MNRAFDHSKTKFPLQGKHREVECVQCHAAGDFRKHLFFAKCSDCHHPDPHEGQFARRAGGSECSNCHSLDAFKPSTFGLREHAATAYPLEGKHTSLRCAQCHIPRGKATIYTLKSRACTDCHADRHEGQFASSPHLNRCEDCHNVERFLPSTFGLRRHNETPFHLNGSHVAVPCLDCHKQSSIFAPKPTAQYHWPGLSCRSCHADPHAGRFDGLVRSRGANPPAGGCEICHSAVAWSDLSPFDHSKTSFPLRGAHKSTKCADCHKAQNPQTWLMRVDFKLAPARCGACHADVHGSQFSSVGGGECIGCHDTAKWKPSLFDHDKQSSFALEGAHRKVRCESCHTLTRMVDRKPVLFYKPTPKECVACHGRDVRRASQTVN